MSTVNLFHFSDYVVYKWRKRCDDKAEHSYQIPLTKYYSGWSSVTTPPEGCARYCRSQNKNEELQLFEISTLKRPWRGVGLKTNWCKCWFSKDQCDSLIDHEESVIYYGG